MGHAVYHRTASGEAQLEDVSSLEAALELVERLRNEEGPTEVRLLKEIPVEVRTYYRVVAAEEGDSPSTPPEPVVEAAADGDTAADVVADDVEVAEDGDENVAASEDAASSASDDDAAAESDEDAVATSDDDAESDDDSTVPSPDVPVLKPISAEPPAGAMPLLSPPPTAPVHADEDDAEPVAASSGRPKLFNRG